MSKVIYYKVVLGMFFEVILLLQLNFGFFTFTIVTKYGKHLFYFCFCFIILFGAVEF